MLYRGERDETLVMLTLAGETRAYETLVVRYQGAVLSAANSVIHNGNLAEDAAQDAFITAWMKLDTLREPEKFGVWVCRIAKNCAKNMIARFRGYLPLDAVVNTPQESDAVSDPETVYASSDMDLLLHESIAGLPKRVREVIELHYFEGLSIAEIADRMRISAGAVKYHLHEGRKRIRKGLCAMDERINDTLVERVMKKVEELKLWQFMSSKDGFEVVYRDVLRDVEELPESAKKYHALADVLMRGWWWLPGKKNDELFARIVEAAELGHNDEVMKFIVSREDHQLYGGERIAFMRDKQIPRLEAAGFRGALAYEWFWLGHTYFDENDREHGFEAYDKVMSIAEPGDRFHAYAAVATEMERKSVDLFGGKVEKTYRQRAVTQEFRVVDGQPCHWKTDWYGKGFLCAADVEADFIFTNASLCDGSFTVRGASVGETFTGSDGTTLTFAEDNVTVDVPCGRFDGCELWITKDGEASYRTYYKDGVGIVKQERVCDGITETRMLKSYSVKDGQGLIPFSEGNTWEYTADFDPAVMLHESRITVHYADGDRIITSQYWSIERLRYDEDSWLDMIQAVRNEYFVDDKVCDVSHYLERAEALAKTPLEKAHTKYAGSVVRRIMETDPEFNPDGDATGHWNFFKRMAADITDDEVTIVGNYRWSFELKNMGDPAADPLLYNDIYGILQDTANCIRSEKWRPGALVSAEYTKYGDTPVKTEIVCTEAGEITTPAGTFADCMKLSLDTVGFDEGWEYRGGKKAYYFAPGVGIIKTENYYCKGTRCAVYELTSYEGTGDGYMPFENGMRRRFDAKDLTDGYAGWAEFEFVCGEDGRLYIMHDLAGIRNKITSITQYSSILGEVTEDELWYAEKQEESRVRNGVNNFSLLVHMLGRPTRAMFDVFRCRAHFRYRMRIMDAIGADGEIPPAWLGNCTETCFRLACYIFGCGEDNDEGFRYLDRSLDLCERWMTIPDGCAMEVGDELVFGGIRVIKGEGVLVLPDGTREPLPDEVMFSFSPGRIYTALTAPHGWEWFDNARRDERFVSRVERAKKLMEKGR